MTAIIHLETDQSELLIQKLRFTADGFYDRAESIYNRAIHCEWEGAARSDFLHELYICTAKLKDLSDQMDQLAFQLSNETEQWLQIASTFGH